MRRAHVLYVERDDTLRETVAELLTDDGYWVTPVPSGVAAVRALRVVLPDVCVIEVEDDDILLDTLRSDPRRYGPIAVVALSFGSDRCPQADVDVHRPYTLAGLEGAVEEALARKRHGAIPGGDAPEAP